MKKTQPQNVSGLRVLVVVLCSSLLLTSPGRATLGTRAARLGLKRQSTARINSAHQAYRLSLSLLSTARVTVEDVYRWSIRIAVAQLEGLKVTGGKLSRGRIVKALKAHRRRMQGLLATVRGRLASARAGRLELATAQYFVKEATFRANAGVLPIGF